MRYKTKVKIFVDAEDKYLEKGEMFDIKTVHIIANVACVHILPVEDNERAFPELLTADVIDRYCEEMEIATEVIEEVEGVKISKKIPVVSKREIAKRLRAMDSKQK